jgi:hypothetical protein
VTGATARGAAATALLAVVMACSSGSGPATASVTAAQACTDNAHQRCARLQTCSPTDLVLRYGSQSACESRETSNCTEGLAEPLSGNTPAAVEACAGAYAGWACTDYLDDTNIPAACQQQLGSVIVGGACAIDGQCQGGFCAIAPGAACGTCAALPKAGASCAQLISCGPGLTCAPDTFTCVAFGVRGSLCGKGLVCGVGLTCAGADVATNIQGTCQQAGEKVGVACDPTGSKGAGCDRNSGLVCNSGSKTCQTVVVASAGQPCGDDVDGQPVYCQADGVCTGASVTAPGTCTSAEANGSACNAVTGPGCIVPARCIGKSGTAGTCQYSGAQTCPD